MVTTVVVSADEVAAKTAGAWCFAASNLLDDLNTSLFGNMATAIEWRVSGAQDSGTDITDANKPSKRLHDRHTHLANGPAAGTISLVDTVYLHMQPLAGTDDDHTFDVCMIKPLNFESSPRPIDVQILITDSTDPTFSSPTIAATFNGNSDNTKLVLLFANRHTDIDLVRISFATDDSSNFGAYEPEIGEVLLGRRRQLGFLPLIPFDEDPRDSRVAEFISDSGVISRHVFSSGRQRFQFNYSPTPSGVTGLDEVATLRSWFSETNFGSDNFLLIDSPDVAAPHPSHWCYVENPELNMLLQGPTERRLDMTFVEVPPYQVDD